jgi:acyl carrier protein
MPQQDVAARLISLLAQKLGLPAEGLDLETSLKGDLGLDSMTLLEVVMEAEERFGVEIEQRAADRFVTIGDVVRFLEAGSAAAQAN